MVRCVTEGVSLLTGDFNEGAQRKTLVRCSPLEAATSHMPLPSLGTSPLWRPGGVAWLDSCGFVKLIHAKGEWLIDENGSFDLDPVTVGLKKKKPFRSRRERLQARQPSRGIAEGPGAARTNISERNTHARGGLRLFLVLQVLAARQPSR